MTSSYALDTATDQAWEKVITHAAAALRAVEDTALIGRAGDEERPWGRPVGTEVPPKLWPALAAYAARTQLEIVRSDTDGQPEQRRIAVGGDPSQSWAVLASTTAKLAEGVVLASLGVWPHGSDMNRRSGFAAMAARTGARIITAACNVGVNPYRVIEAFDTAWRTQADAIELREMSVLAFRTAHKVYAEITDWAYPRRR